MGIACSYAPTTDGDTTGMPGQTHCALEIQLPSSSIFSSGQGIGEDFTCQSTDEYVSLR